MNQQPLVEIHDLVVCREGKRVLEIDHLTVERGDVLAVAGPNGAGKSTLFLTLAKLLNHEKGSIKFEGIPLDKIDDTSYRRRIALILQEPLLFNTTVYNNIAIGMKFRGQPKELIEVWVPQWLERMGIKHLADTPAQKLSGGESQRVSLARAFVLHPELLLLDEPFSALDAPTRLSLLGELKDVLRETGTTAIFITHDLSEASRLANRMAIILSGKLSQTGAPREILKNPVSAEVAAFLGNDLLS